MHGFSFWSISERINSSLIAANESLSRPRCEKMDLNIIQSVGKGSNTQTCWKIKVLV